MMNTLFNDAIHAWPQWDQNGFFFRLQCLDKMAIRLKKEDQKIGQIFSYHLQQAKQYQQPQLMPGPTGETNELYLAARGVSLIYVEFDHLSMHSAQAVVAQIAAALVGGNSVIVCCDAQRFIQQMNACAEDTIPTHLLSFAAKDEFMTLSKENMGCFGFIGTKSQSIVINRQLSKREGPIAVCAYEMMDKRDKNPWLNTAFDPALILRFITERTRTINVTAIGGNATLLELGTGHE